MSRIDQEKKTVERMIHLYCRLKEGNVTLCADCIDLLEYARRRLDHCKFGERKTTCRKCPVHCYRSDMRARMKNVMRFTGPRMILHHPIDALRHLWQEI